MTHREFQYTMCPTDIKLSSNPFVARELEAPNVWRPMVRVVLSNGDRRVECLGLIDSGADFLFFPHRFAALLNIDLSASVITAGIGALNKTFVHAVVMGIPDFPEVEPFAVDVGFGNDLDDFEFNGLGVGVLGQLGFFDRFRVSFDYRQRKFALEPYEAIQPPNQSS